MRFSYIRTLFSNLITNTLLVILDVVKTAMKDYFLDVNYNIKVTVKSISCSHPTLKGRPGGTW